MAEQTPDFERRQCDTNCRHQIWIQRWIERERREIEKEKRRQELIKTVKANVVTWLLIGFISYLFLSVYHEIADSVTNVIKRS